jgi:type II secretory pathway component PulK
MLVRTRTPANPPREGIVLITVLVVVVVLTLAAYQYSEFMMAEYQAANSHAKIAQTKAAAMSGVNTVAGMISSQTTYSSMLNGNPFNNTTYFKDQAVGGTPDNPKRQARFSIIGLLSPDDPNFQSQPYSFGVVDEAGKINLNALLQLDSTGNLGLQILMGLPNMTEDIANCILDWLDPNTTTPRPNGAKDETYMELSPPYHCKNGPLDSLDELLLVQGVTPQLLYGNDYNQNGMLDANEDSSVNSGMVDRGWSAYLTVYSREPNADSQGNGRIFLNDTNLSNLYNALQTTLGSPDLANFIIAYRLYGSSGGAATVTINTTGKGVAVNGQAVAGGPGGNAAQPAAAKANASDTSAAYQVVQNAMSGTNNQPKPISSVYSLITATVSVPVGSGMQQKNVTLTSPLSDPGQQATLLPLLLDKCTTIQALDLPPRINVNTASQTVLASLPMFTEADVQAILSTRPSWSTMTSAPDAIFGTPAWLITEAKLSPNTVSAAERYITARSNVYSFQSIGYFDGGGPVTRLEAVVDTNWGRPRIVHLRDITLSGKGFPVPFSNPNSSSENNLSAN